LRKGTFHKGPQVCALEANLRRKRLPSETSRKESEIKRRTVLSQKAVKDENRWSRKLPAVKAGKKGAKKLDRAVKRRFLWDVCGDRTDPTGGAGRKTVLRKRSKTSLNVHENTLRREQSRNGRERASVSGSCCGKEEVRENKGVSRKVSGDSLRAGTKI